MVSRTNLNFKFNSIPNCSLCEIKYGCWRFKALDRCSISWNRTSKYSGEKWRCSLNSSSIDGCGHNCEAVPRGMIMFILIVFITSFGRKIICLNFGFCSCSYWISYCFIYMFVFHLLFWVLKNSLWRVSEWAKNDEYERMMQKDVKMYQWKKKHRCCEPFTSFHLMNHVH